MAPTEGFGDAQVTPGLPTCRKNELNRWSVFSRVEGCFTVVGGDALCSCRCHNCMTVRSQAQNHKARRVSSLKTRRSCRILVSAIVFSRV